MDKAIFELAEKLHHPSDIGTKLDAVEKAVKEEYEEHEDTFKRKLILGYEHIDEINRGIEDLSKQFSEFKIVESKSVEILRSFTSLVRDYKTVKTMCKAHQRFVKVKEFVESLQTVDEECECEDIGEYHDLIYSKEEFMYELMMYNDGISSENFARVQHAVSTIQRQAVDFKTVLVEMVSDLRDCKDQEEKLNRIVEREEKRDELSRLAQEGEKGQDPELQALTMMYPQYLTRKPKELKKSLISAIHGAIESKFTEIDTTKAFVGSLSFVLEDLEFINKNVRLEIFTFDDALKTYHHNLKRLIDQTIERLDAGEILSIIEYKMDYYNKIEASYGRVSEALGPSLIKNESELLEKYAATAAAKLQEWIENIAATEVEKFAAREGGIARDE
ncbi:exocyst complex component 3, partial [Pancytospora epiphaga]